MTDGKKWVAICLNIWGENRWIKSTRKVDTEDISKALDRAFINYDLADLGFPIRVDSQSLISWMKFESRRDMNEWVAEQPGNEITRMLNED